MNNSAMNPHALLLSMALLLCPPAFAQMHFGASAAVVDATIQSVRSVGYQYRSFSSTCGYIHEATVTETFKGRISRRIVFASNRALVPQSRALLFLRSHDGDFPTDSSVVMEDPEDPGFDAAVRRARKSCIAVLPRLRTYSTPMGSVGIVEISTSRDGGAQFVVLDSSLPGLQNSTKTVEWNSLREWLLRNSGDILDTSRGVTLRQMQDFMRSNLDKSRRLFAADPAVIASIEASQKAWENYQQASCASVTTAWPEKSLRAPLLQDCRLRLTSTRAGELDSLRNGPAWYTLRQYACDDACVARELEEATATMNEYMERNQKRFAARSEVIAALDASQKAWDTYMQSSCALVTTAWPDNNLRAALLRECRLRSTNHHGYGLFTSYDPDLNAILQEHGK